jgi:hypothetical protein
MATGRAKPVKTGAPSKKTTLCKASPESAGLVDWVNQECDGGQPAA